MSARHALHLIDHLVEVVIARVRARLVRVVVGIVHSLMSSRRVVLLGIHDLGVHVFFGAEVGVVWIRQVKICLLIL